MSNLETAATFAKPDPVHHSQPRGASSGGPYARSRGYLDGCEVLLNSLGPARNPRAAGLQGRQQLSAPVLAERLQAVAQAPQAPLARAILGHVSWVRCVHVQRREREAVRGCSITSQISAFRRTKFLVGLSCMPNLMHPCTEMRSRSHVNLWRALCHRCMQALNLSMRLMRRGASLLKHCSVTQSPTAASQ